MAALVGTLIVGFVMAGLRWFVGGSRGQVGGDSRESDWANLVIYGLGALPVSFVIVFFGIGG